MVIDEASGTRCAHDAHSRGMESAGPVLDKRWKSMPGYEFAGHVHIVRTAVRTSFAGDQQEAGLFSAPSVRNRAEAIPLDLVQETTT